MPCLLQVSHLTVNYRTGCGTETTAVAGVSFAIGAGEVVGLLGESGCGKSTTALALLRLLPFNARIIRGSVAFGGRNLLDLPDKDLTRIRGNEVSFIFHEPSVALNPVLRVGRQISEVLRAHRPWTSSRCQWEAGQLLARVGLSGSSDIHDAFPHELSGGQKQRVLIAQALACDPALIIADEPTTGLDTHTQADILDVLKDLKERRQTAFLLISHHPGVLARLADRLLVMYAGRIVEEGRLTEVYARPRHPYTAGLLAATPGRNGCPNSSRRLVPIPGNPPDMNDAHAGCPFVPRCPIRMDICSSQEPGERILDSGVRVWCHACTDAAEGISR